MSIKIPGKFPTAITILLIEDMDNLRVQMISDLKSLGHSGVILEAACVADAIQVIQKNKIDFIICDWNLPDGTGFDLLVKFRKIPAYSHIPYVMCTTMDEISNILNAIQEGANDYIVKPWKVDELNKKITSVWANKK